LKKFGLLIIIVCVLIAEISFRNLWLAPMEDNYIDLWHQLADVRSGPPASVVIVSVDQPSLEAFPDDPLVFWGPHFAKAIARLREAGAIAVGMDFLFAINSESWLQKLNLPQSDIGRTYEIPMREQLSSGQVVLVGQAKKNHLGEDEVFLPVVDYLYAMPEGPGSVGLANLFQDDDGVVRHFISTLFDDGRKPDLCLGAELARRFFDHAGKDSAASLDSLTRQISYLGPPGTIPRLSFYDLLFAEEQDWARIVQQVKDKVIIISVEQDSFNDLHLTPYSRRWLFDSTIAMMSGAEIHANIAETIIRGNSPQPLGTFVRLAWLAVATCLATVIFLRLGSLTGLLAFLALCLLGGGFAYSLFLKALIVPLANLQFVLGLCYLVCLGSKLTGEERYRKKIQQTMGPYVSKDVMTELMSRDRLPALGGETMEVSALFSDIRGFTTISEKLAPHEVVEILNTYYSRICDIITDQGGIVDKFIGDAVMAIFGAPVSHPDHARRCLLAGLAMNKEAVEFQSWLHQRFPDRQLPDFRIGVGMHTGEAVIGNIGSSQRMEYTAIGDTINVASRLEGLCKKFSWSMIASQECVRAAGDGIEVGGTETVVPTGRTGGIVIYEIKEIKMETR